MRTPTYLLMLIVVTAAPLATCVQPIPSHPAPATLHHSPASDYYNCIEIDLSEVESLRSNIFNFIDINLADNKDNISFGLLEEDWARLKLLEMRLPVKSPLRGKLVKLFRLLLSALYQAHRPKTQEPPYFNNSIIYDSESQISNLNASTINISDPNYGNVNHSKVLEGPTSSVSQEEIDNEAAESEPRPSVISLNTHPTHLNTVRISEYDTNSHSEDKSTKTPHTVSKEFSKYSETEEPDNKLPMPNNLPKSKILGTNKDILQQTRNNDTSQKVTPVYGSDVTEDYQGLNIKYEKEHGDLPVETEDIATTTIQPKGNTKVDFIEEVEKQESTTPSITVVPGIEDNLFLDTEKADNTTSDGTGRESIRTTASEDNITPITPSPGIEEETTQHSQFIPDPTNSHPNTVSFDGEELHASKTSTTTDSGILLTSTLAPTTVKDQIHIQSPYTTSSTNGIDSRQDKSLHSTSSSPIRPTQKVDNPVNNIINDTFKSFTLVFPEYPKVTSPTTEVNKLLIYPYDGGKRMFYPFSVSKSTSCNNKKGCAKVKNIEFYNPKYPERYNQPNSGIHSEDSRNAHRESNRKRWNSDNALWWHKMRSLRKKNFEE
ncbi:mucin-2-like [Macrosteles quadrilineatus]|uniref:mucin-2-like n=1 Tax=Macrosteles quadrilineatus TaxID=74068 RepID=UPI0023E178E5|nr:mucin-2-like [Macrosteles quadrilineatus]